MAPPPPRQSEAKRKSLPTDFRGDNDKLPDAETVSFNNKRKRQEPPPATQSNSHSLRTSFQPHHKRSRTMDHPQGPRSVYGALADFSHLDENTYDHERVLQQARRLVGHAKLDTTRGDYFALKSRGIDPDTPLLPQSGIKRDRVDEQTPRVQKLLKPSSPTPSHSTLSTQLRSQGSVVPLQDVRVHNNTASHNGEKRTQSPGDLLAQLREVREALAEGTAWFKDEREKSERLSSSRSSEVALHSSGQSQSQLPEAHPQGRRHTPTRAQIRLERTKANGLLPDDWDWNKSVNEWKMRGGTGSPRANSNKDQSGTTTPAIAQPKRPLGFAAVTNGLGRRAAKVREADEELYDDDREEGSGEGGSLLNGRAEVEDGGYPDDGDDGYDNSQNPEDEEDEDGDEDEDEDEEEDEEFEEEDDLSPEQGVLQGQGGSADTAIDLD
ncbi:MAG: hypothetical protein Q9168_003673 [Polycauliona sp. 1 TL-2023]